MGVFNDRLKISGYFKIDGVAMPDPTNFIITENNVSDGGTLGDGLTHEGTIVGVKHNIEWQYAFINLEHYLKLYNATQKKYNDGTDDMYFIIEVPCSTAEGGIKEIRGYFQSQTKHEIYDTTAKYGSGDEYWYGGKKYDELRQDVVFSFVEK